MSERYHGQLCTRRCTEQNQLTFSLILLFNRMAALPLSPLQNLFENVLSLNLAQRTCLHLEDIFDLGDLLDLSPKEMADWANRKSGLTAARGGCRWGIAATKKLQALIFWAIDSNRRGTVVVPADFTPAVLAQYREFVSTSILRHPRTRPNCLDCSRMRSG